MEFRYDVAGVNFDLDDLVDYRLVQVEYIFRPVYIERENSIMKLLSSKKYEFLEMGPFAAIIDEKENILNTDKIKSNNYKDAVVVDVASTALHQIGNKLNIKELKYSKYKCKNQAGRVFNIYLQDVPAQVKMLNGKVSDVYKNDELYSQLGEPIAPTKQMIPMLKIKTKKETFEFYGNGIQIVDAVEQYKRLGNAVEKYKLTLKEQKKEVSKKNPKKIENKKAKSSGKKALGVINVPNVNLNKAAKQTEKLMKSAANITNDAAKIKKNIDKALKK